MKKIALIVLATFVLNFGLFALPLATTHAGDGDIYDMQFNVKKNLKVNDFVEGEGANEKKTIQQAASYFDAKSPIVSFITKIIEFATYSIGSIAVILIIIAGFMFMVSQGNEQKLTSAKEVFQYAMIGLIIVFLSYIITIFVQAVFTSAG
jgi:hypothetical protein